MSRVAGFQEVTGSNRFSMKLLIGKYRLRRDYHSRRYSSSGTTRIGTESSSIKSPS